MASVGGRVVASVGGRVVASVGGRVVASVGGRDIYHAFYKWFKLCFLVLV